MTEPQQQKVFFEPLYDKVTTSDLEYHRRHASNLRRMLVHKNGLMPLGLLEFCLKYCQQSHEARGVFEAVRFEFSRLADSPLLGQVENIYDFRNTYVAHVNIELTDRALAEKGLRQWIEGLVALVGVLATQGATINSWCGRWRLPEQLRPASPLLIGIAPVRDDPASSGRPGAGTSVQDVAPYQPYPSVTDATGRVQA